MKFVFLPVLCFDASVRLLHAVTLGAALLGCENTSSAQEQVRLPLPNALQAQTAEKIEALIVRHISPKEGETHFTTETDNFTIYHMFSREKATEIAQSIETMRRAVQKRWLNTAEPWRQRCEVYVYTNGKRYEEMTGYPGHDGAHATMVPDRSGEIVSRAIHVRGDHPQLMNGVLPHEITHAVLAGSVGARRVPRWLDEGAAIASEAEEIREMQRKRLLNLCKEQGLFSVHDLLTMDYPKPTHMQLFYVQSASFAEYLERQKNPSTILEFVRHGSTDASAKKYFGAESLKALDEAWQEAVWSKGGKTEK